MTTKDEWLALFKASGLTTEQAELAVADLCDPGGNPPPASATQDGQTERKPVQEDPAATKQKPALSVRWRFADGKTVDQPMAQHLGQGTRYANKMADSDDPYLRVQGQRALKKIDEEREASIRARLSPVIASKAPRPKARKPIRTRIVDLLKRECAPGGATLKVFLQRWKNEAVDGLILTETPDARYRILDDETDEEVEYTLGSLNGLRSKKKKA